MWDGTAMMGRCLGGGTSKLIVSVSFGSHASFKWKGKSIPDGEARSCWLDHGGVLIMDGQCQGEFVHCADPSLEQERIDITLCSVGSSCTLPPAFSQDMGGVLIANACAGFFRFCYGVCWEWCILGFLGAFRVSVHMGGTGFAVSLQHVHRAWASHVCLSQDRPIRRRSAGALPS